MRALGLLVAAALLALPAAPAAAGEDAAPPPLEITSILVEPAAPGPDTLCKLRVGIKNRGAEAASRFAFEVKVGGQALRVYEGELLLQPVAPGETAELRLHNFWSSETGRPFPGDGKLTVEVTLTEATRVRIEDKDGEEVRTPLGDVDGLPVSRRVTLGG